MAIMSITSSHFKFTTPFCQVLPVHNILTVNRNKLVVNFSSSFSLCMKKPNYCTNLTFGGILNQHGQFKHTLRAQRCRDCGRWTLPCHTVTIAHSSTAISEKISLKFLLDLYLYFPNIPRTLFLMFVAFFRLVPLLALAHQSR
jgi:hypothetical protein